MFRSLSARDCSGLHGTGQHNGTYTIYPYGPSGASVPVYCEYNRDGVWTVIREISLCVTAISTNIYFNSLPSQFVTTNSGDVVKDVYL